jgi:hypothetical protein
LRGNTFKRSFISRLNRSQPCAPFYALDSGVKHASDQKHCENSFCSACYLCKTLGQGSCLEFLKTERLNCAIVEVRHRGFEQSDRITASYGKSDGGSVPETWIASRDARGLLSRSSRPQGPYPKAFCLEERTGCSCSRLNDSSPQRNMCN